MKKRYPLSLLFFLLIGFQSIWANVYYVNDNSTVGDQYTTAVGNNSNDGSAGAPFATVTYAISQATAGDTIYIDAGSYAEAITVDKQLYICGEGENTVIQNTGGNIFTYTSTGSGGSSSSRSYLRKLKLTGSSKGVYAAQLVNYLTIDSVNFNSNTTYAIHVNNTSGTMYDWLISNCTFHANSAAYYGSMASNIDGVTITGSTFTNQTGSAVYIGQSSSTPGGWSNVTITGNTFSNNGPSNNQAALYIEKLDNGVISGNSFSNNGLSTNPRGIIINLKYGTYDSIEISDNIFLENRGAVQTGGYGINVQGRNDASSYNTFPASLSNVSVSGNEITGFLRGIEIDNAVDWSSTSIENNAITNCTYGILGVVYGTGNTANASTTLAVHNNSLKGATYAIVNSNTNGGSIDATCNWYDTVSYASISARITGNTVVIPYLTDGNDTSLSTGFQPDDVCDGYPINISGTGYATIQEAIDNGDGQRINIGSGTYNGDLDATAAGIDVTLAPGNSPGCVTVNGNLSLNAGDTLLMDMDGVTACTGYDQWTYNGTVSIGGSTLYLNLNYAPVKGDTFLIVSNDGSDAITGQFAEGTLVSAVYNSVTYYFQIKYNGGDGNDIVLTLATVHNLTQDLHYTTIQSAVNAATAGDQLLIDAGNYHENVSINKRLHITGVGNGADSLSNTIITAKNSGTSTVVYSTGGTDSANRQVLKQVRLTGASGGTGNNNSGILISASSNIGHFTFDSLVSTGNTGHGLVANLSSPSLVFHDVIISNDTFSLNGSAGIRTASHSVDSLKVFNSFFQNNTGLGIAMNPSDNTSAVISNVTLQDLEFSGNNGVADFYAFRLLGKLSVNDVDFKGSAGSGLFGLYLLGGYLSETAAPIAPSITLNNVNFSGTYTSAGLSFLGYSKLDSVSMNNVVLNTTVPTVNRGQLRLSGVGGNLNIGNTAVNGTSALAIHLNSNFGAAGSKATVNVDATNATFNGLKGSDMTLTQLYDLEDKIRHGTDNFADATGIVRVKANNLFVTSLSGNIQQSIDSAFNGDTINIKGGAYTGNMDAATGLNASKDLYFNLGTSPACDTLTGNMTLNTGDTLMMDLDGTTPCSGHDQYLVNGTVSLGGATLDLSLGYTPSASDIITLIDNDGTSDAVTGTFSQGSSITVGGYTFTIQYDGGDGNDVVLYLAPTIACPADTTVGNDNGVCTAVVNNISPVTTGLGTSVTYVITGSTSGSGSSDASGITFNKDTSYVKYVVTDGGGNKDSCTFWVVVLDTSAPTFTRPADTTLYKDVSCIADTSLNVTLDVTDEADNCNSGLEATYRDSVIAGSCQGSYIVKRIWSLSDSSGNAAADQIQTITVLDSIAPVFTRPADTTIYKDASCIADTSTASTGNVIDESDNCSTGIQATYRDSVLAGSCQGTYIIKRIWSLVDSCGNAAADQIQTINVLDNSAPTFTRPSDTTLYKDASCIADTSTASTGNVIDETDNCSTGVQATYRDSVVAGSCQGTYIVKRIWSLVDSCGNAAADQIQTITVLDNTAPTFTRPSDTTLYKDASCIADTSIASTGNVIDETDNCSTGIQANYRDSVVAGSCQGTYIVKRIWSLVDSCGNAAADQIQTINVLDNSAPSFTRPADTTLYKDATCIADTSTASTGNVVDESDNCSTGIQATYRDSVISGSCQGTYIVKRIWSLVDSCGNAAADQIQTINVLDSTKPVFTAPRDTTLYKNSSCFADTTVSSTGDVLDEQDNCTTNLQASYRDSVIAGSCEGTYTVKRIWSLADSCGNAAADQIQTIVVNDTTRPVITDCKSNTTRKTTSGQTYYLIPGREFDVTATDNCSSADSITYRFILSGALDSTNTGTLTGVKLPFGTTTIKWVAIDACDNVSDTCVFTVKVDTITTSIGVGDITVLPNLVQQYSDSVTLLAKVAPWPSVPTPPLTAPSGKIVFYIGTERMGEAIVSDTSNPLDDIGEASITVPLLELQSILDYTRYNAGQPTNGPLKPGIKDITAVFVSSNPDYADDTTTAPEALEVTKENAIVKVDNSTGYFTVNPTSYKGVVWFRANVSDTNDVPLGGRGDIRNATLQFLDGSSYPSAPINGTRNVGLIDPNDKTQGQSVLSFEYQLNNTEIASGGKSWVVWAEAGNYYTGYDNSDMNVVTLGMPGSDFVTGGGHYIMELSGGAYAGTTGKKMNFGFNMKWNKSGKNLQGKINIIYRRVIDGQMRIFHIKSNAIGTLAVSSSSFLDADGITRTYSTATMTSQASLTDITDPYNPIGYGGNNNLRLIAWDNKQSGSAGEWDKVAVELLDGKTSQLLFSSYITGGSTKVRTINGGNVNIRNTNPTVPPACALPYNLNVSNLTNTSATLNWLTSGGLRDSVEYRVQGSAAVWTPASVAAGTLVLNVSSLLPGTLYEWRVMTICTDTTRSAWSNSQFTTPVDCNDAPTGLMSTAITSSSATLKWSAVSTATGYLVEYRLLGESTWNSETVSVNYYNMSGLDDDTTYEWRVTNICSSGPGTPSGTQQFITPSGCVTGNLLANMITTTSARLQWNAAPSATGYNLRWKDSASASTWNDVSLGTVNYYDLSGLSASMEYWFQVQVVCGAGNSPWADTAVFTTLAPCGTPTNLQTSPISDVTATFKWTAVPGALSYDVQYRIQNSGWSAPVNVLTNSYNATALDDDTTYEWSVRAICSAGTGNWSSVATFKTLKTVTCGAPYALHATTYANKTSALLSWSGTSGSLYTLQYKKTTAASWTSVTTAATSYSLNLSKNTTYKWQVTASCLGGTYGPTTGPDFTTGVASTLTSDAVSGPEVTMLESGMMQLKIQAYPNPTTGQFTLSMSGYDEGQVNIRVVDMFGKTILNTQQYLIRGRGTTLMQLGNIMNGVYIIQVAQKEKVKTLKLMKD